MRAADIAKDKLGLFLCRHKYTQDFFVVSAADAPAPDKDSGRCFYDIDNIEDYKNVCERYNFKVTDAQEENWFRKKSHFCVLTEDGHFGCWGWYTASSDGFWVLEIDRTSPVPENTAVLFHFYTNENYRRKGYYVELLRNIVSSCTKDYSIIYAYNTNTASTGAIKKAGFRYMGNFSHKTFPGFEVLVSDYNSGAVKIER